MAQVLKDLEFPADKKKIMEFLEQQQSKNLIYITTNRIRERIQQFADITKAAGLVE